MQPLYLATMPSLPSMSWYIVAFAILQCMKPD
jgi:hypothetical protein